MHIGIEASRANKPNKTGVEWYAYHIIQELKKITALDSNSWSLYTQTKLKNGLEISPKNWEEKRLNWPFPYGWTQIRLSYEMMHVPSHVLWLPGSTLPRVIAKKTVVTVHDIGFHRYPAVYKKRQIAIHEFAMREIKERDVRVVTVSEFSKKEIVDVYGIDPEKIFVTYNGVDHALYFPQRTEKQNYFLCIGRLEKKKNILNLIRAFNMYKKAETGFDGTKHKLYLVGIPGNGFEEISQAIHASPYAKDIIEKGYILESELPHMIRAATALVHPAFYEGFGIPPVQAMACGIPVISSNIPVLSEILGDAALYHDPVDIQTLAEHMIRIRQDADLVEQLRIVGIERASRYTWGETAKKTLVALTQW